MTATRTRTLHPVNWTFEATSPSGFYAYGFGGGLPSAVTTDVFATQEEALRALKTALSRVQRCPDRALCNERTEAGRRWLAILDE